MSNDKASAEILDRLYKVIVSRKAADPSVSHTAKMFSRGTAKIAQKVGEEAVEALIEAIRGDSNALAEESADLVYHLMVLWADSGLKATTVWSILQKRFDTGGVYDQKDRKKS